MRITYIISRDKNYIFGFVINVLIIRDVENNYIDKLPITVNSVKIQEKRLYFSDIQCYNIKDTGISCVFMPMGHRYHLFCLYIRADCALEVCRNTITRVSRIAVWRILWIKSLLEAVLHYSAAWI